MNLGLYIENDQIYITESRKNENEVEILNTDKFKMSGLKTEGLDSEKIDNIAFEIRNRIDCKKHKNLDITLPSGDFLIDYFEIDPSHNYDEANKIIEEKLLLEDYIAKKIYSYGLENSILMTVSLKKDKIKDYFDLSSKLGLRPRTLTPYFSKLYSEKFLKEVSREANFFNSRSAIIYSDDSYVDMLFIDSGNISFFKRIDKDTKSQSVNSFLDVIKFYISNSENMSELMIYHYGKTDTDCLKSIEELDFDIKIQPLKISERVECSKEFNSIISAY